MQERYVGCQKGNVIIIRLDNNENDLLLARGFTLGHACVRDNIGSWLFTSSLFFVEAYSDEQRQHGGC